MTKCTSLNKLPHSKRWIQQITIISNYWIQLSYDLKNYADLGGNYRLRRITPSEICKILKVIRKPNPTLVLLFIWNNSNCKGWYSGESAPLPPVWPEFNPSVDAICGLSLLLVLTFAPRGFSPGTFLNSNSTRNLVDEEPLCGCTTSKTLLYLKEAKSCSLQSILSSCLHLPVFRQIQDIK